MRSISSPFRLHLLVTLLTATLVACGEGNVGAFYVRTQ
jgi:hypothetical protein